ncbi:MAG: DUF456 domain-containing protein [Verrucomicrobiota bacterium]
MDFFTNFGTLACELAVWSLLIAGIAGSILPVIPGSPLVLAGAILHKLLFPEATEWWLIVLLIGAVVLAVVLEWLGGMLGAKYFGSSKWGIIGALVGGLIGLFFSLLGILIGPIIGAVLFEWCLAKKEPLLAAKAGLGVIVGIVGANVTHFIICLLMVISFAVDAYLI